MNLKTVITLGFIGLTTMAPTRAFSAYSCDKGELTSDPAVITKLMSSIGYTEAFVDGRDLAENPFSGNQCHVALKLLAVPEAPRRRSRSKAAPEPSQAVPQLVVSNCKLAMTGPAAACQSNGVISITLDSSKGTGVLSGADKNVTLNFKKMSEIELTEFSKQYPDQKINPKEAHWRLTSPMSGQIDFAFKSQAAK